MTDPELIQLLRCPETRQPLVLADAATIHLLNNRISAGAVQNRGGITVVRPCDGGLVRQDGLYLYPIREAIPEMLISESMPLAGMRSSLGDCKSRASRIRASKEPPHPSSPSARP